MGQRNDDVFKDPTELTRWTKIFLYAMIVMQVVAIVSGVLEFQLLMSFKNGTFPASEVEAAAQANDSRQAVVGMFQVLFFIVTGILFLKFIYRANYNARRLGAENMRFSPGWSVGWYFVPIANLWKPYQAMKEIWRASKNPRNPEAVSVPSLLPWWWLAWLGSNVLGRAPTSLARSQDINSIITASVVAIISDAFQIVLCFIGLALIGGIYRMQTARFEARAQGFEPITPDGIAPS